MSDDTALFSCSIVIKRDLVPKKHNIVSHVSNPIKSIQMSDIVSGIGDNSSGDEDMEIINFVIVNVEDQNFVSAWGKVNPLIVPISFLSFENELNDGKDQSAEESPNKMCGKYPKPPYKRDDEAMIRGFVSRSDTIPPESWPQFKCLMEDFAATFKDAERLFKSLTSKKKASPKKAARKCKGSTRTKLLALAKKDGLGRKLIPLTDSLKNLTQSSKKSKSYVASMGTVSPLSSSPSKRSGTSDDSTFNKEPSVYNHSLMIEVDTNDQHLAPPLSVRKTSFCSPSVEGILAKCNSRDDSLFTVNNPSPDLQNGHLYTLEVHDGVETSSNYTRETTLKDSILSEIRAEIDMSEKRLKNKMDVRFEELKNIVLRERNLCVKCSILG
ncbi:hypothetical protein QAD02_014094 [Eretmocerus hayati]|uniref:Uncharacterized protein n=1 Tax=Eretmocerus hayati TaxID=131215 RepID=A0ACC2P4I6_9HYME|nr:hypothetical protein QAD02_014094 [Eretmocerus hayati]